MKKISSVFAFLALGFLPLLAWGQPKASTVPVADETANFEVEILLRDLDNPSGLTVRSRRSTSGPFDLFMAESGAGRILQLSTDKPDRTREVITGFRTNPFNDQLPYRVGPLSLAFLTLRSKLIVGDCGHPNGNDQLSVYIVPSENEPLDASQRDHFVGDLRNSDGADSGSINFLAMVKSAEVVYLSVGGDDDQGVLLKAGIKANRLAYLQPLPIEGTSRRAARGGIAMIPSPQPPFLVVADIGSYKNPHDSALEFYILASGKKAMSLPTGLHDMMSLAYSPSGQLYAADFAWSDPEAGGVYRLDDIRIEGRQGCQAVRIASVTHPMTLAFTPDGTLYVTAFGSGVNKKQGTLIKITGDL